MGKRSRKRKMNFQTRAYEKQGTSNLSASIYASMMQSDAWGQLSGNAIKLYLFMKLQQYGQTPLEGYDDACFVFNRGMYISTYHIFSNGEQFNKYAHELIQYGFIEIVQRGQNTRTKNIYRYSGNWKEWTKGVDFRPKDMIMHDEALAEKRRKQRTKK